MSQVPLDIGQYLSLPPVRVRLWPACMLGASVPETAIYEDGNASFRENYVGPYRRTCKRPYMHTIPQAQPMKQGPYLHFCGRILASNAPHTITNSPVFGSWFRSIHRSLILLTSNLRTGCQECNQQKMQCQHLLFPFVLEITSCVCFFFSTEKKKEKRRRRPFRPIGETGRKGCGKCLCPYC